MKYLIFSDLHGKIIALKQIINIFKKERFDKMIILGDLLYHGPRNSLPEEYNPQACIELLNLYADSIVSIKGNCDAEVDQMVLNFPLDEKIDLRLNGHTFHLEHGHHLDFIYPEKYMTNYILYGHYHVPKLDADQKYISPGSCSIPKEGSQPCFIELDQNTMKLRNLDGDILKQIELN